MSTPLNHAKEYGLLVSLQAHRERQLRTLFPSASAGVLQPVARTLAEKDAKSELQGNLGSEIPEHGQGQF